MTLNPVQKDIQKMGSVQLLDLYFEKIIIFYVKIVIKILEIQTDWIVPPQKVLGKVLNYWKVKKIL